MLNHLIACAALLLVACSAAPEGVVRAEGSGSGQAAPAASPTVAEDLSPIFGLPRLPGTRVEFQSEALAHARIDSSVRETVATLLAAEAKFAVTRFDGGTRLIAMDGSGRSIFVYRLPGERETLLSYFAASRPQETGDGSAAPEAQAAAPLQRVRRGASAAGTVGGEPAAKAGGIKVGSDGLRFSRPDSLAEMQRLLERPSKPVPQGPRRVVPNEPILDAAGRPTGYERTLYGRVVRSAPPPRLTPVRRNDAVSQY